MIAVNSKMNNGPKETSEFLHKFGEELKAAPEVTKAIADKKMEVAFFVPAVSLLTAVETAKDLPIVIGAQNTHWEKSGAFTGETSVPMINEIGAASVLIGHSERRHIFRETDDEINKKVHAAHEGGLLSVLCVGETLDERESGHAFDVIRTQFEAGIKGFDGKTVAENIIIAYEPVWAIGTGKTASDEDAEEICRFIRELASGNFCDKVADELIILYGGSVKPENTHGIISQPDIDGVLVGGASLKPDVFMQIVKNSL